MKKKKKGFRFANLRVATANPSVKHADRVYEHVRNCTRRNLFTFVTEQKTPVKPRTRNDRFPRTSFVKTALG